MFDIIYSTEVVLCWLLIKIKFVSMINCHLFKIQMQGYDLIVRGKDLQMSYYDEKEIRLCGYVKVIEYAENGV